MINRRKALTLMAAGAAVPAPAFAAPAREIMWEDLIPLGVPYSEIIGPGMMDETNDIWLPEFDENATKMNEALHGTIVKLPGFIIPFEFAADGVTEFMLVPYEGACLHVPPPPANQLVMVRTATPWPSAGTWEAVWVTGIIRTEIQSTEIAVTGYALEAEMVELYAW